MRSYSLLHQLLFLVEQFEQENQREATLSDFIGFLVSREENRLHQTKNPEPRFGKSELPAQEVAYNIDNNISRLLIFMYRYAKSYLKKALEGTPLLTPEDFTCLAILLTHESISKTKLIRHNIQEKTSGTVVIARLVKAGLVKEWSNKKDKRGKLVSITASGRELLYHIFHDTSRIGKLITGKLDVKEKFSLQYLLQKLEEFHYPIYSQKQVNLIADIEKIVDGL